MSRRRHPPLFEFLGAPDRRGTVTAEGNVMGRRPIEVPFSRPAPTPTRPEAGGSDSGGKPARAVKVPVAMLALVIAGGLTIVAVLWSVAFSMGQQEKEKQLTPHLTEAVAPKGLPAAELPSGRPDPKVLASTVSTFQPPLLASAPVENTQPQAPALGEDPRRPGVNYLELCVLTFKDGEAAAQYLAKNGVPASLIPAKNVDPAKARANNQPHILFVTDGVASERFRAAEKDRKSLEAKVEQIGKRWLREERGASDFSRPVWRLFKGKE